jgi:NitT/TauT family transport system substrate-binding protein
VRWWEYRRARRAPALLAVVLGLGLICASCGGAAQPSAGGGAQPPAGSESRPAPNPPSAAATSEPAAAQAERAAPASAAPAVDPDTQNASLHRTTVAYSSYANAFAPLYVAAESGLFAKYGLDTDLTYVGSATVVTQGLLAGDIGFAGVGPSVIDSRLAGSDLVIIADLLPVLLFTMYGDPAIGSPQELRGRTVGSTRPAATGDQATNLLLNRVGLVPGRDVTIVHFGEIGAILAAMQQELADAALLSAPTTLRARDMGFREIINLGELRIPFVHDAIASSTRYARENPDTVRRFLKAYIEAIKLTQEDKPRAIQAIGKYTRTEDVRFQEEAYDNVVSLFPRFPRVSEEVIQGVLNESQAPNAKSARAAEFYDNTDVDALRDWTDQLYKK